LTILPHEKVALKKLYSDRLAQHGPTLATLGWTKPTHTLRYRILLEYWLSPAPSGPVRLLDFGCGFGDLFGYARSHGIAIDYTGLDINQDLINVAAQRYPEARFLCLDLLAESFDETFDVVVSSGAHNYRFADNRAFIEHTFGLFDRLANWGFAVNFLSDRVNFKSEVNHHSAPEDMLKLALRHSQRVSLRHDYMPFEFTVFVDKRSEIEPDLNVFLPFAGDCKP
jgi:SAM-dependent methyltransferase